MERLALVSGLPIASRERMRLGNFEPGRNASFKAAADLARGLGCEPGFRQLLLYGPPGVGKTHLAAGIGWDWIEVGAWTIYRQTADLLEELRACYDENSDLTFDELFTQLKSCHLLILDDLGAHRLTEWAIDVLDHLVDWRYLRRLPTVATTNRPQKELPERIADRLSDIGAGKVVLMKGPSYRQGHRP